MRGTHRSAEPAEPWAEPLFAYHRKMNEGSDLLRVWTFCSGLHHQTWYRHCRRLQALGGSACYGPGVCQVAVVALLVHRGQSGMTVGVRVRSALVDWMP